MSGFSNIKSAIKSTEATYNIQPVTKNTIILAPIIIMGLCAAFLAIPGSRRATLWMLRENHPVELLTFLVALAGGIVGLVLARRTRKCGAPPFIFGFYALFSVALIFIAMEEIAWGQQLFKFATPAAWSAINIQGETTVHNIKGLQGKSEMLRLFFGVGGLAGVWLSFHRHFKKIGSPAILFPWFIIITIHSGIDVYNDYFPIQDRFDYYMQRTSELVELLIVISALLYLVLNLRLYTMTESN